MTAGPTLAVLASGEGTTLQAILDACAAGEIAARVGLVVSNNSGSGALTRARRAEVPALHVSTLTAGGDETERDRRIRDEMLARGVELVLLAGYCKKVTSPLLAAFPNRVLNSHPSLLPEFGGPGMYGDEVHRAVLQSGASRTGISLHLVVDAYDSGPLVAQRPVAVLPDDDLERLSARVKAEEKRFLVEQLQSLVGDLGALDQAQLKQLTAETATS